MSSPPFTRDASPDGLDADEYLNHYSPRSNFEFNVVTILSRRGTLFHTFGDYAALQTAGEDVELLKSRLRKQFSKEIEMCMIDPQLRDGSNILHWIAETVVYERLSDGSPMLRGAEWLAEIATMMNPEMLLMQKTTNGSAPFHLFIDADEIPIGAGNIILTMCQTATKSSNQGEDIVAKAILLRDRNNKNCLHLAVRKNLPICQELIEMASLDAVVTCPEKTENTPLHDALESEPWSYATREYLTRATQGEEFTKMETNLERHFNNIAALIAKNPHVLRTKNSDGKSPYLHFKKKKNLRTAERGENTPNCNSHWDEQIEQHLFESAFSLGGFTAACECLFESKRDSEEGELVFRPGRPLTRFDINKTYSFLKFKDTLAQVNLSIEPKDQTIKSDPILVQEDRENLLKIFRMLKARGVRKILKLTVQDNPDAPCSDEFIGECLRGFDIRYLDWNKPDICIDVFVYNAPRVSELCLYATGNRAVIRSWANNNALPSLHQLRLVCIHVVCAHDQALRISELHRDVVRSIEIGRKIKIVDTTLQIYANQIAPHETYQQKFSPPSSVVTQHSNGFHMASGRGPVANQAKTRATAVSRPERNITEYIEGTEKLTLEFLNLLTEKEKHQQHNADRLQQLSSVNATGLTDDQLNSLADFNVSDLRALGIQGLADCSHKFGFIALEFRISSILRKEQRSKMAAEQRRSLESTPQLMQHRWMDNLKEFVLNHVLNEESTEKVKLAVVDDGIDPNVKELEGKIKAGWPSENATSSCDPFYHSAGGHGTALARLIVTACPHVELYVAKLRTIGTDWKTTAEEAAEAISWARKQGVQIIIMAWSFTATDENKAGINKLNQEITAAAQQNIIMYRAAADQGMYGSAKELWPGSAKYSNIKVVGSAAENGQKSKFVNPDQVDYLFPGEELAEIGNKKGSSAATALAAGFAALMIWCYKTGNKPSPPPLSESDMDAVFQALQVGGGTRRSPNSMKHKWVDVSKILENGQLESVAEFVSGEVKRGKRGF